MSTIRVERVRPFPVSAQAAFAYITDITNWKHFFPGFVRINNPTEARWGRPGDRVTVASHLFRRQADLQMELEEFQPNECVRFVLRQRGLPDMRHERLFKTTAGGCECCFVAAYDARAGLAGLVDRLVIKWAVARSLDRALSNLDLVLQQPSSQ